MVVEFKLPEIGEGVSEGEIVRLLVTVGQQVKKDQPIVEVMTDKATVEISSPVNARVGKILVHEGESVKVGTNLVILDDTKQMVGVGESATDVKEAISEQEKTRGEMGRKQGESMEEGQDSRPRPTRHVVATPATRKLAHDLGIAIERVIGSGPGGKITAEDVKSFASLSASSESKQEAGILTSRMDQSTEKLEQSKSLVPQNALQTSFQEETVPIRGIRKRIAERMLRSSQGTAPVTHVDEVDFTELIALRDATKTLAESKKVKVTFLPFVIKAVVTTLKQFPYFNATIDEEKQEFKLKRYYNIGIATDTSNGLIVPVIKDVDKKGVFEIARDIERLSEDARNGSIQLADLQEGTFTITNIGSFGGIITTPIINVPEVAILGLHKVQKRPVVVNDKIVVRDMAYIALTFDHRIVDGADAARFTSRVKFYLENPGVVFVE